jgi:hypothetical protein
MSVALVDALFKIACLGYWTFKFQKYGILCNAMVQLSMIHYWLFAVKYLESGINCSGYFDQPISRLTYSLMLAACVPFIAALFYLELVLFLTYPTLEPAPDADAVTCELMHRDFVQEQDAWILGPYDTCKHQFSIIVSVYIVASILATLAGMAMLVQSYRRISK